MLATLRSRDFGLLWLAGLISGAGDMALIIALPLHVYRLTDSTLATAVSLAVSFLPGVLIGSIAGVFVDRWDRKRTMIVADVARAALLVPIVLAPDRLSLLYAVAAAEGTIGLFFTPAKGALLPALVGEERLVTANALAALNSNLGMLIGPALGAFLYAWSGIGGAAIFDAASFLASAVLIRLIAAQARPGGGQARVGVSLVGGMLADWRSGLGLVRQDVSLRVLFIASSLAGVAEGVFLTLGLSPLVLDVLRGTPAQVGWLGTAQAVGGLVAGVAVARIGRRLSRRWLVGAGMLVLGMCDFGAFNSRRIAGPGLPAVGVAMGWMVLAGFPAVANVTGKQALVQHQASDAYRGRVFGALGAVQGLAMILGFALGGVLGDTVGLVPVLSASATLRMLGGLVALARLPRHENQLLIATEPQPESATTASSAG